MKIFNAIAKTGMNKLAIILTGSFNPVTVAHLRLLELVRDFYESQSIKVVEGIISPVCDAYAKPGLLPVAQRIEMLVESVRDSDWIRIDTWEGNQSTWIRSKFVLDHHHEEIKKKYGPDTGLRFICGADVAQTMINPNIWIPEEVDSIMNDHGLACICRVTPSTNDPSGSSKLYGTEGLPESWKAHIDIIEDWVVNDISSTNIRKQLAKGGSVKYVVPDGAIRIIKKYGLYGSKKIE